MTAWNFFRIVGDISHLLSKCILVFSIHLNRSAEGVSFITQALYALVFCARYLDVFTERFLWNLLFKIVYIVSSLYILAAMQWVFPRSREREISWKLGAAILAGSLLLSPLMMILFEGSWSFQSCMWVFSIILESVCVLPQLLLLRQTNVPTVIDSFYLVTLGAYRAFYCLNWFVRELDVSDRKPDVISVVFGIIQTALYLDFAWVYYTRQRVKLRGGGVVDADDMRRGWILRRIFGKSADTMNEQDEESIPALAGQGEGSGRAGRLSWGARGISVSADEGVVDMEGHHDGQSVHQNGVVDPDAKMEDPDELAKALVDDDDEEDDATRPFSSQRTARAQPSGTQSKNEWHE